MTNTMELADWKTAAKQIRILREEAIARGDYWQADLCDRALSDDVVDQDGNEISFADMTREEAYLELAEAIAEAAARAKS